MTEAIMNTYKRLPVSFVRGEGAWLWDDHGRRYLDALSGIAVCGLGHSHPAVGVAVAHQVETLLHTSNLYGISLQEQLGEELTRLTGMQKVFFSNSGAEANEAAIKIARHHGNNHNTDRPQIIVMEGSFHGRTLATLAATGNPAVHAGFEPLMDGFVRVPYNDLAAVEAAAAEHNNIVAVLVEPVQGEGGINIPSPDYLPGLRALCDQHNWLLMLDEIQTGMGRSGRMFAFEQSDIIPDVLTLAKALGNGIPIGACLARGEAAETLVPGTHGSTFGGNLVACSAALAVIETLESEHLAKRAAELGDRICNGLAKALENSKGVQEIRHQGLLIGVELDAPCAELVQMALDRGLLINVTAGKVIRLLPPLILNDFEADQIVSLLGELVREYLASKAQG